MPTMSNCDVLCIAAEEKFCIQHGKLVGTLAHEFMTDMRWITLRLKHPVFYKWFRFGFLPHEEGESRSTEGFYTEKVHTSSHV